jgi:hypothetical protein
VVRLPIIARFGSVLRLPLAVSSEKQVMQEPQPLTEYLDALSRAMWFDVTLARRVRKEVEDHLWESATDASCADTIEAQRYAVAKFGDPHEIARQYVASSLFAQTRRVGLTALLAFVGIYVAMKGRGAWYGMMQWGLTEHLKDAIASWITIDLNAFRIALAIVIFGLAYVGSRQLPVSLHRSYCRQAKRCVLLCCATAGALLASVLADAVITGFRVYEAKLLVPSLIPFLSIAVEVGLVTALGLHIRAVIQRIAFASSLLDG